MKNRIKTIILSASVLLLVNCNEEHFNVFPNDQDADSEVFTNEANFRTVLDGAYDAFKRTNYYNGDTGSSIILGDILADNLIWSPKGRGTNKVAYEWAYSPTDAAVTNLYEGAYHVIARSNQVLANINNIPNTAFMKNIEAEAKAIRAIAHFDIARAYAKIPTQSADAPTSMGIAYVDTFDIFQLPSRDETVAITYDKIIADLQGALSNINAANGGVGRLNRTSVLGYLSKVYLYKGDYQNSVLYGEQAIAAAPSVGSLDNFPAIWTDATDDGEMLTILNANISTDNVNVGGAYNQNVGGIKSESNVNYDLFTKYGSTDVRKSAYVLTANFDDTPYNHVIKHRTRTGQTTAQVVDIKLLRSADVYLTVAEAHMKSSIPNPTRALALLNILRAQRYSSYVAGTETGTALLDAILYERRLEMAFENDRFWTIKRLGLPVVRSSFGSEVDGGGTDGPTGALQTLPASSHRFVLPIPQSAINLNPNIKQNPKY